MRFHVLLIANEGYARGLAVSLQSLLESLKNADPSLKNEEEQAPPKEELPLPTDQLHVWLLDCGLLPDTWTRLEQMIQAHNQAPGKPLTLCRAIAGTCPLFIMHQSGWSVEF